MKIFSDYLRILLFAVGVLLGLQVPGFVEQYGSRLEARVMESNHNLQAFQADADKYFDGDIARLITHYKNNSDQIIQDGGNSIDTLYQRNQKLISAFEHFSRNSLTPFIHTFTQPLTDVRENTWRSYNFLVLLNTSSIIWGAAIGLLLVMMNSLIFSFLRLIIRPLRSRPIKQKRAQSIAPDLGL